MRLHAGFRFDARPRRCAAAAAGEGALCTLIALCLLIPLQAAAGEPPTVAVGGLLFGDAYHVPSHHSEGGDGATGLVLRRGYLTFDSDLGGKWFGRLRFEVNQSGEFETYEFDADVKDLYVGWKAGRHRLIAGLSPTPTFDVVESAWGMRYLAKTPMDLQSVASRDTGLSASGRVNGSGTLSYRAMLGTSIELGSDSNDSTKWMGALTWKPSPPWTVDLYADLEERGGASDRTMLQFFAAWRSESIRWGMQYSNQNREEDPPLELVSAFVVGRLKDRVSLVGRVDRLLEPSPKGDDIDYLPFDPSARATMFIAGVEFRLSPHVVVTPNTVVIAYDTNEQGIRPETDVHLRVTFFVDFE